MRTCDNLNVLKRDFCWWSGESKACWRLQPTALPYYNVNALDYWISMIDYFGYFPFKSFRQSLADKNLIRVPISVFFI